jgi:hypothetical protein
MLKKSVAGVFAPLKAAAYHLGKRLFTQAMGGRVKTAYASVFWLLRPCWTDFVNILPASFKGEDSRQRTLARPFLRPS